MTYCFHLKYIIAFILFGSDNVGCQSYCFKWLRNYTNHNSNRRFVLSSTFLLQKWTWFFILFGIAIRPSWLFLYETYYQIRDKYCSKCSVNRLCDVCYVHFIKKNQLQFNENYCKKRKEVLKKGIAVVYSLLEENKRIFDLN